MLDLWSVQHQANLIRCSLSETEGVFVLRLSMDGRHLSSRPFRTRDAALVEAQSLLEDYSSRGWTLADASPPIQH